MTGFVGQERALRGMRFGLLSPDEIRRMSVTKEPIQYAELFEAGKPKRFGLLDPRQGPANRSATCETCKGGFTECPGHFSYIELTKPVYHIAFLPRVLRVLRCVCFNCSNLLIDPNDAKLVQIVRATKSQAYRRLSAVVDMCKRCNTRRGAPGCPSCGQLQPKYKQTGAELTVDHGKQAQDSSQRVQKLSAERVQKIFEAIPKAVIPILGFHPTEAHPAWMLLSVVPVPPMSVRPSVVLFNSANAQDDLTYALANIIRADRILRDSIECGASDHVINANLETLQCHCASLVNNNVSNVAQSCHKNGRALKSIKERLDGKEGRIRGNLMGKRVDFSARTVITPDPNLAIDQVGVPRSIAQNLTVPEIVSPYNVDWLHKVVQGELAKSIISESGERIVLQFHPDRASIRLQHGSIVERQMIDDDLVVLNRQPTLHKMSMMAHRVKILPGSTFRLNISATTPYNADFDGDEMNLHLPQSLEARAELSQLMTVPRQLLTPQSNRPVMGIVQDALLGAMKMTRRSVFITKSELMNLLMLLSTWDRHIPQPAILKPQPLWTGKQVFSLILPRGVNCIRGSTDATDAGPYKWISPSDSKVIVEDGQLLSGILCKRTLGPSAGSLGHIVFAECGHEAAARFYSEIQLVVNHWLMSEGHSVGVADVIPSTETAVQIVEAIDRSKHEAHALIARAYEGKLTDVLESSTQQALEKALNSHLNNTRKQIETFTQNALSDFNQFKAMVVSGSKGSPINILQIVACVGQQNVEGKRIPFAFKRRTLPHFLQEDCSPEAKGFVENSYLKGLNPSEFFFHAMGGREGLIDTAVKTQDTGYFQRRLVKAMESVMVKYDGTVRNQEDKIIQFIYGEDGLAGEHLENQSVASLNISDAEFERSYRGNQDVGDAIDLLEEEWQQLCADRRHLRELVLGNADFQLVLPCHIDRLIHNAQKRYQISPHTRSDLSPRIAILTLRRLLESLVVVRGTDSLSQDVQSNATMLMNILLRSALCSQRVIHTHRLTGEAFDWLCDQVETRFQQANVHPGEMVGMLAAQSIGEPATQMTLNTFHFAGVSAKNVTLGIPRLTEITNVSKVPKTPSMTIFLEDSVANDPEKLSKTIARLEHCSLKQLVAKTAIYYDPNPRDTVIDEDLEWVNAYYEMPNDSAASLSGWVLRIELDKQKVVGKRFTMENIYEKIHEIYSEDLDVIFSDDNADKLVLRIRLINRSKRAILEDEEEDATQISDEDLLRMTESILLDLTMRGIKSLSKVYITKAKKRFAVDSNGSIASVDEVCLVTEGSSLREVLAVEGVDCRRTQTNDIVEISKTLGIEATRIAIEQELNHVISFDGAYVNRRHLALLCEVMTARGFPMSITRHGINRQYASPLLRVTFEETLANFVRAAVDTEHDPLQGVSERILVGQMVQAGTGAFDLLMNAGQCTRRMNLPFDDNGDGLGLMTTDAWRSYQGQNAGAATPWQGSMSATPAYDSVTTTAFTPRTTDARPFYNTTTPAYDRMTITSPSRESSYGSRAFSPAYSVTSPAYTPRQPDPAYSPTSPSLTSYAYPSAPSYVPRNPSLFTSTTPRYNPTSPAPSPYSSASSYGFTSPQYSPYSNASALSPTWLRSSNTMGPIDDDDEDDDDDDESRK